MVYFETPENKRCLDIVSIGTELRVIDFGFQISAKKLFPLINETSFRLVPHLLEIYKLLVFRRNSAVELRVRAVSLFRLN